MKMKSEELGLPIEYQQYPEYFDIPSNANNTHEKNKIVEAYLKKYKVHSVADLTCGTGAQVLYLAKHGYQVVGSDFSPGLIDIAKKKALNLNVAVQFFTGDIRYVQLGEFDAVITIDNAIGHLVKADFEIALKNIHQHLKPGGIYIFDILNLDEMTDEVVVGDSQKMSETVLAADGTTFQNVRRSTIDRDNAYLTSFDETTFRDKTGQEKTICNQCTLQIYTMDTLREMLDKYGFKTLEQHKMDTYTFHNDDAGYGILTIAQREPR